MAARVADATREGMGPASRARRPCSSLFVVTMVTSDIRLQGLDFRNALNTMGSGDVRGLYIHGISTFEKV